MPNPTFFPTCSLCHKPVELETTKVDERGKAVHEECYLFNLKKSPPKA